MLEYKIYAQDGSFVFMNCGETQSNKLFIEWIKIHDRYTSHERTQDAKAVPNPDSD